MESWRITGEKNQRLRNSKRSRVRNHGEKLLPGVLLGSCSATLVCFRAHVQLHWCASRFMYSYTGVLPGSCSATLVCFRAPVQLHWCASGFMYSYTGVLLGFCSATVYATQGLHCPQWAGSSHKLLHILTYRSI